MDLRKLTDKAKGLADEHRDKLEDLAEKGVAEYEKRTDKQVPDHIKAKVDDIDQADNIAAPDRGTVDRGLTKPGVTPGTAAQDR